MIKAFATIARALLIGFLVSLAIWTIIYRFKHPELTETELFLHMITGKIFL